jgi:hypothetical protein
MGKNCPAETCTDRLQQLAKAAALTVVNNHERKMQLFAA